MALTDLLSNLLGRVRASRVDSPGHIGQPNNPALHMSVTAGPAMRDLDTNGAEFDGVAEANVETISRAVPTYRLRDGGAVAAQPAGSVALADSQTTAANSHLSHGSPDLRRTGLAPQGNAASPEVTVFPEDRTNERIVEVIDPVSPPSRPRQGFTGADPTRAAQMPIAFTMRAFDQGIAQHPGLITKVPMDNPTAARPPERKRLAGARPSIVAGAASPTGMIPVGVQPNTTRTVPSALGTGINQVSVEDTATGAAARRNGWRLA
jgi:hypothetical protein